MTINIWEVEYSSVFSSTSDGRAYSNPPERKACLVLTNGTDIKDVLQNVSDSIGNQSRIREVHSIRWLGESINTPRGGY